MTRPSDSPDDSENRSRDESPPSDRRRRRSAEASDRDRGSTRRARGERSPEWPFAPAEEGARRYPSESTQERLPAARRVRGERSPEWPFAPPEGRPEGSTPERSGERPPQWGLHARPDVDVAEHPDEVHVWCDLPGCEEDTIELSGDEWTLYVSAERSEEYWEEGGIQRRERSQHAERSISLPARSDVDSAEATFEDGVLYVRAPKHESDRTRTIGFQ